VGVETHGHCWKFYSSSVSQASTSHPLIGPQPALGISAEVARVVIRGWTSRKHEEYWQSIQEQRQGNGFLKIPSAKRAGELLNLNRNQPRIMMGLLSGHYHLKGHLFNWCWQEASGEVDANSPVKWCHLFCMTIRHWWYQDLGTWANIS